MTRKLVLMLATSVAFGNVTQVAHASCGGTVILKVRGARFAVLFDFLGLE
jgi:hypothetical protein